MEQESISAADMFAGAACVEIERLREVNAELLAALEMFVEASKREIIVAGKHKRSEGEKVYLAALAAIAKARGQSQPA